jgi:hypothetical protein
MLIRIKLDGTLYDIARTVKCAPCQILFLNNVRSETELLKLDEIVVPIITSQMVIGAI